MSRSLEEKPPPSHCKPLGCNRDNKAKAACGNEPRWAAVRSMLAVCVEGREKRSFVVLLGASHAWPLRNIALTKVDFSIRFIYFCSFCCELPFFSSDSAAALNVSFPCNAGCASAGIQSGFIFVAETNKVVSPGYAGLFSAERLGGR